MPGSAGSVQQMGLRVRCSGTALPVLCLQSLGIPLCSSPCGTQAPMRPAAGKSLSLWGVSRSQCNGCLWETQGAVSPGLSVLQSLSAPPGAPSPGGWWLWSLSVVLEWFRGFWPLVAKDGHEPFLVSLADTPGICPVPHFSKVNPLPHRGVGCTCEFSRARSLSACCMPGL